MVVSSLIIAVSVVLFCYWFRYTCVLILNTSSSRDFGGEFAEENGLRFAEVQARLGVSGMAELSALQASLARDYQVVTQVLRRASSVEFQGDSLEDLILRIDYRLMSALFGLAQRVWQSGARAALEEMTQIVAHLANTCGERAAVSVRA
jgi:hypothetical protein